VAAAFSLTAIFNEKYPDEKDATLYELVRSGKWTIDRLTEYISNCWDDVNSNGKVDGGDVVGMKNLTVDTGIIRVKPPMPKCTTAFWTLSISPLVLPIPR
jgi:hypothetical protein